MFSQGIDLKPIVLQFMVVPAVSNRGLCEEFSQGHSNVLREFNIPSVNSESPVWYQEENCHICLVRNMTTNELIGGGRLHIHHNLEQLGLFKLMKDLDTDFDLNQYTDHLFSGEVSGLWTKRGFPFKGLSTWIISSLNLVARRLKLGLGIALCSPYSIQRFTASGWEVCNSVGENGYFNYPNLDYRSAFMLRSFSGAFARREKTIFNSLLRTNSYTVVESKTTGNFIINIDFSKVSITIQS